MLDSLPAATPRKLSWVVLEASLTPGPGETVTRPPASISETSSADGTQLGLVALALAPLVLAPAHPEASTASPSVAARPPNSARTSRRRALNRRPQPRCQSRRPCRSAPEPARRRPPWAALSSSETPPWLH